MSRSGDKMKKLAAIAVLTVALLTATVNLGAMIATIWLSGLGRVLFAGIDFSFLAIAQIFAAASGL